MSHSHQCFRIDVCLLPGATERASLLKGPLDSGLNLSRAHPVLGFCCNLERFDFFLHLSKTVSCYHSSVVFVPHTTMLAGRICLFLRETLLNI